MRMQVNHAESRVRWVSSDHPRQAPHHPAAAPTNCAYCFTQRNYPAWEPAQIPPERIGTGPSLMFSCQVCGLTTIENDLLTAGPCNEEAEAAIDALIDEAEELQLQLRGDDAGPVLMGPDEFKATSEAQDIQRRAQAAWDTDPELFKRIVHLRV